MYWIRAVSIYFAPIDSARCILQVVGLQRPVICICNNVHAAALRPLRAVAECIEFRDPNVQQIASRLKYICTQEKMQASQHTLATLTTRAGKALALLDPSA